MLKDQDIREPLFDFFDEKFGKVRIIEEKQIAKSRADVMLVLEEKLIGRRRRGSKFDSYSIMMDRMSMNCLLDRICQYRRFGCFMSF